MTDTPTAPAAWVAWRRRRGERKWRPVASGATEAEASRRLFEYLSAPETGSGDSIVLPKGREP